jgi:hypothetical protein
MFSSQICKGKRRVVGVIVGVGISLRCTVSNAMPRALTTLNTLSLESRIKGAICSYDSIIQSL